jgi:hypothetical protein
MVILTGSDKGIFDRILSELQMIRRGQVDHATERDQMEKRNVLLALTLEQTRQELRIFLTKDERAKAQHKARVLRKAATL